ncbi:excisionase family DNA-binding protein [Gordonia iterans]
MARVSPGVVARPSVQSYNATIHEVAADFGVHPKTVRRWLADGRIHGHRIGPRLIRFNLDEVRRDLLGDDAA